VVDSCDDLTEAAVLMRAPHGRIHFAGSDIAALDAGAIEGALVIRSLCRPQRRCDAGH
jgi:hypothetical protein